MSQFLRAIVNIDDELLLRTIHDFLNSELCPDFEEDVDLSFIDLYKKLELVEFASELELRDKELALTWFDEPDVSAAGLIKNLGDSGVQKIVVYEIEDYADESDDPETDMQGFVYFENEGRYQKINYSEARMLFDSALLTDLQQGLEL